MNTHGTHQAHDTHDSHDDTVGAPLRRRGLIAGAAALAVGVAAHAARAEPVAATQGSAVLAGLANTASATTSVTTLNGFTGSIVLYGDASNVNPGLNVTGVAGQGAGAFAGVQGYGGAT